MAGLTWTRRAFLPGFGNLAGRSQPATMLFPPDSAGKGGAWTSTSHAGRRAEPAKTWACRIAGAIHRRLRAAGADPAYRGDTRMAEEDPT